MLRWRKCRVRVAASTVMAVDRISIALNHIPCRRRACPGDPEFKARSTNNRGGRDKPGHPGRHRDDRGAQPHPGCRGRPHHGARERRGHTRGHRDRAPHGDDGGEGRMSAAGSGQSYLAAVFHLAPLEGRACGVPAFADSEQFLKFGFLNEGPDNVRYRPD
jgi:hypothetical protein